MAYYLEKEILGDKTYQEWEDDLEKLPLDEQIKELRRIKSFAEPAKPNGLKYIVNGFVYGALLRIFDVRLKELMPKNPPDWPREQYVRNLVMLSDDHRMLIFLTEYVVNVCAGHIGCLDGVPNKEHEVCIYSMRSRKGVIDYTSQAYYVNENDEPFHKGEASNPETWNYGEVKTLVDCGISKLVILFCEEMRDWR
jgi:hypothetical protein